MLICFGGKHFRFLWMNVTVKKAKAIKSYPKLWPIHFNLCLKQKSEKMTNLILCGVKREDCIGILRGLDPWWRSPIIHILSCSTSPLFNLSNASKLFSWGAAEARGAERSFAFCHDSHHHWSNQHPSKMVQIFVIKIKIDSISRCLPYSRSILNCSSKMVHGTVMDNACSCVYIYKPTKEPKLDNHWILD